MFRVKLNIDPEAILLAHGLNDGGAAQRHLTETVNKRITAYMPYRSGNLSGKYKRVTSPSEITISTPYAHFQYAGLVWIYPQTGSTYAPKHGKKVITGRPLTYDTTKNAKAGPFWDRRLMAAEGKAIVADLQEFIKARDRK